MRLLLALPPHITRHALRTTRIEKDKVRLLARTGTPYVAIQNENRPEHWYKRRTHSRTSIKGGIRLMPSVRSRWPTVNNLRVKKTSQVTDMYAFSYGT